MSTNPIANTGPLERIGVRLYRAEKPRRLIATLAPIDHEELIADHLADCWNACGTTPLPVVHAAPDLLAACIETIEANRHLADGNDCTLRLLVRAVEQATGRPV